MKEKVYETIEKYHMLSIGDGVVIGVSGGADSCALLHIFVSLIPKYQLEIRVIHVNHGLRGKEAERDQEFVRAFCERLHVPFHGVFVNVRQRAVEMGIGEEEAGRILRYKAFEEEAKKFSQKRNVKIAVAHNENDQAETLLMRICRGTGLRGLSGIPVVREKIIRPLLFCSRKEIEEYLKLNGLSCCQDSTNQETCYTRNKIRLFLLPWMEKELNSNAISNIARTANLLRQEETFLEELAEKEYQACIIDENACVVKLSRQKLKMLPGVLQNRVLRMALRKTKACGKDVSLKHIEAVQSLLEKSTGALIDLPLGQKVQNEYDALCIYSESAMEGEGFSYKLNIGETIFIKEIGKYVVLSLNEEKKRPKTDNLCTKSFDYDKITVDLQVRTRQPGDRIYLKNLGMKKLKDYFIDEKIPRQERNQIPLLAAGQDILWIIGHRVSGFFEAEEKAYNIIWIQIWEDE